MNTQPIVVLTDNAGAARARSVARDCAIGWPGDERPDTRIILTEEVTSPTTCLQDACALLLVTSNDEITTAEARTLMRCVDRARESRLPILLIGELAVPNRSMLSELTRLPIDTPSMTVAAMLAGMIARQNEISTLVLQAETTARMVGNVHEQMTKIDEELQAAGLVQRNFLPDRLPRLGSIEVGTLWRPTSYVSGDYYDVRRIDDRHISVFLVDAAGHGVPSALMTVLLARAFDCAHEEHPMDPAKVMTLLNKELCIQQEGITQFATAVHAVVDCHEGTMTYSSAGHPPPLLLNRGALRALDNERAGGLLGVFPEESFESMTERLHPGDTILLHSDGFEQAFPLPDTCPDQLTRPTTAYLDVFKSLRDLDDPTQMITRITETIDSSRGSLHPCDDLTLLCIHHFAAAGTMQAAA